MTRTIPNSYSHDSIDSLASLDSTSTESSLLPPKSLPTDESLKLVIICVGLPARGKSYITKKLQRYLNWQQYSTKIFNVGNTRRQVNVYKPSNYPVPGPICQNEINNTSNNLHNQHAEVHDANFFDNSNVENFQLREKWAKETLDHLLDFLLSDDGNVGIFDATNTTKKRRRWIIETINRRTNGTVKILFLESICTDKELIEKNIRLKLSGPDYKKMNPVKALHDFKQRLKNYEKVYETIDENEEEENEAFDIQYVKIINAGKKIISYNISGYLSSQCVFFLLNFNLADRQIWLTPNGESEFNVLNRKGGDSDLTIRGLLFSKALPKFIAKKRQEFKLKRFNKEYINDTSTFITKPKQHNQTFNIWSSTLRRTIETVKYFPSDEYFFKSFKMLNDLGCGSFDSITEHDFRSLHPDEYKESLENKLSYRYPGLGGESYLDVISRLRPIIVELERLKDHVLIVSHTVIIRVLLCYFMNLNKEMLTELDVQHGFVYCIEPKPYGLDLNIWQYDNVTDMFYEVDVGEIMKRKRKRGSMVSHNSKLRNLILQDTENFNNETNESENDNDNENETESESESDESESGSEIDNSNRAVFCQRSDSDAYEFIKERSKSSSFVRDRSISSSFTSLQSQSQPQSPLQSQSRLQFQSENLSKNITIKHAKKHSIDWDIYDNTLSNTSSGTSINEEVDKILQNKELVNKLLLALGQKL